MWIWYSILCTSIFRQFQMTYLVRVPWLLRALVFTMFALCCFMTAWLVAGRQHTSLTAFLFVTAYPLSTTALIWVARLNQGAARRGWLWLAFIPLFMLCADLSLVWLELQNHTLFPSFADIFYFAIMPWLLLGFQNFSGRFRATRIAWQERLDVAICVLSLSVYLWRFALSPIVQFYNSSPLTLSLFLIGATLLLIPLSLALLTLWREERLGGVHRLSFILALATYASLIVLFFVRHAYGTFSTTNASASLSLWIMFLFSTSALLGLNQARSNARHLFISWLDARVGSFKRILPYTPYAAMVASFALLIDPPFLYQLTQGVVDPNEVTERIGILAGTTLISILVVTRQILTMRENHQLNRKLQAFSRDLETRVEERTKQLEDSRARLAANERLASFGRISAGLAHEINTPVAAAMNSLRQAQHLADEYEASIDNKNVTDADHHDIAKELRQSLSMTDSSLERLGEFVRRMRGQVRDSAGKNDFNAVKVVKDSLGMLEHRARKAKVQLRFQEPNPVHFYGDAARFSQVVSNLVVNALDACEEHPSPESAVTVVLESTENELRLEVSDNGVGIPKALQEKIFEPLFTTKDVGKGTGLGLAIIQDIVYGDFDGQITLESTVGQGTTFRVVLPSKKATVFDEVLS
jgi:signal transduction histidine kinase